ncbi:MAG: Rieske 2Fe-2S domain-containing protein [Thiotrichaceae bacterium]|nr:Rieske 2Fe-2S domain-containing protein [Thiotrichaceae bacterium]
MTEQLLICQQSEIEDPGSRGFNIEFNGQSISGFVVQKDGQFFAYRNSCPHTGAPLDWVEHQFLDLDEALIQCAVHDARFNIEKGLCLSGPCAGDALQELTIIKQDNQLFLVL